MIGFVIWSLLGVFIIGLGIKDMFSKNPVGFWANTETIKVKDVKGYNRASGLLFIIYGIIFVILGIPVRWSKYHTFCCQLLVMVKQLILWLLIV